MAFENILRAARTLHLKTTIGKATRKGRQAVIRSPFGEVWRVNLPKAPRGKPHTPESVTALAFKMIALGGQGVSDHAEVVGTVEASRAMRAARFARKKAAASIGKANLVKIDIAVQADAPPRPLQDNEGSCLAA